MTNPNLPVHPPAWVAPCLAEGHGGCKNQRTLDHRPALHELICDQHKARGATPQVPPWPQGAGRAAANREAS